jgi:hypothetical protein
MLGIILAVWMAQRDTHRKRGWRQIGNGDSLQRRPWIRAHLVGLQKCHLSCVCVVEKGQFGIENGGGEGGSRRARPVPKLAS